MGPRPTTFLDASSLLRQPDTAFYLAVETFQHTGSFKFRAAYQVAKNCPNTHVIAASSGNFGQALALACRIFNKRCTVVMPSTSAQVKVNAVRAYGGIVDLIDVTQISREDRVKQLAEADPEAYISSAFDDPWVIAGNSSLGSEIIQAIPDIDTIICPIGGGGLASGLVLAVQEQTNDIKVIAAEPKAGNDAARSFRSGNLESNDQEPNTIADGARTKSLGKRNWDILRGNRGLTGVLEVPDEAIRETVRTLYHRLNLKVEPTGALAVAALLSNPEFITPGHPVCCVVSGGNVDPAIYAEIITEK